MKTPLRYAARVLFFIAVTFQPAAEDLITVQLKVFPADYTLTVDDDDSPVPTFELPEKRAGIRISRGRHLFRFSSEGYKDHTAFLRCTANNMLYEVKLEKAGSPFLFFRRLGTGVKPKSVEFTPDGKYLVTALLEDRGIRVIDTSDFSEIDIEPVPEEFAQAEGFVEIAFVEGKKEMWVSQMTTHRVHIYNYKDFTYQGSVDTEGNWSKVIAISPDERKGYVSNWISGDISVIDIESRKFLYSIPVGGTPRGMAFSPDGLYLYVCRFDNGNIHKINTETLVTEKILSWGRGAKRHIVIDKDKNILYVSDMARHTIFIIDGSSDTLLRELRVEHNPNTIALSSDGRYLFVATRGLNHPESYLIKGYYFGKIYVIDTRKRQIVDWFWGMNQPTGLALSPDNRLLAYTNFLDNTIEVYKTGLNEN